MILNNFYLEICLGFFVIHLFTKAPDTLAMITLFCCRVMKCKSHQWMTVTLFIWQQLNSDRSSLLSHLLHITSCHSSIKLFTKYCINISVPLSSQWLKLCWKKKSLLGCCSLRSEAVSIIGRCWHELIVFMFCPWSTIDISILKSTIIISDTPTPSFMCFHPMAVRLSLYAFGAHQSVIITTNTWQIMCISKCFQICDCLLHSIAIAVVFLALMQMLCVI